MLGLLGGASSVLGGMSGGSGPMDTGSAISGVTATQSQDTGSFSVGGGTPQWMTMVLVGVIVALIVRQI